MNPARLNQISEHVYWLPPNPTTDRPTLGLVVGRQATLLIDAGNSPAHLHLLQVELARLRLPEPAFVVLTHWHWDHVFGASALSAPLFAHDDTCRAIADMAALDWSDEALDRRVETGAEIEFCRDMIKAEWPDRRHLRLRLPEMAFSTGVTFNLGGVRAEVRHVGGDHAADSSVVYVPGDNILFLSDCLYENLHLGPRHYTTAKLFPLLDTLLRYDADHYVWGHHPEPMPAAEMKAFVAQLRSIGALVDRLGGQRELILQALTARIGQPLDEDTLDLVAAFLSGLRP